MARESRVQALIARLQLVFLVGFLACASRAGPVGSDLKCPDYVASFAPLIWLHPEELYMPSDLLAHIHHTTPMLERKPIDGLPKLDLDNLESLNQFGDQVALTSNDDPLIIPEWLVGERPDTAGQIHNSTPCAVVLVEKNEADLDAFYFYFYSYNEGPNITQVLEPLNRLVSGEKAESGIHFGNHVGDWEHNMVRFQNGKPTGIFYSQHVDGGAYGWDDKTLSKNDAGRPVVYSALGTHANYPATGKQVHNSVIYDICDAGQIWDPVLSAYFYLFQPDTSTFTLLAPPEGSSDPAPSSNLTSFLYFSGLWGDIEYPDSDPRQETIPNFGIKRFQDGPTGPRYKHLVRKGLRPDEKRYMSWTEWGVSVFMAWYPCCIRGWRKWVSLGSSIVILSGIVIGVIIGVRRYRLRRNYRKLHVEDIPLEDRRREEEGLLSSSDEEGEDQNIH